MRVFILFQYIQTTLVIRLTSLKLKYEKIVNSQQRRLPTDDMKRTTNGKEYHQLKSTASYNS